MLYLIVSAVFLQLVNGIIIDLPGGKVEGITDTTRAGTTYHSFLALRYAKPPIDDLRFRVAQSLEPWDDVYDATAEKHVCYQVNQDLEKENEDCLFVNVFTPKDLTAESIDSNLTVLVFIHGGGFIQGAGYLIEGGVGPKFFLDRDIVFVAFNYRLGPFGFLATGDEILPGNLGLKDQTFALQWIQKNIKYFGGDPDKVTIFGQSAGAASVAYQLLSPTSEGLFRAAILESGAALSPWAYQRYEKEISFLTAQYVDPEFNGTTTQELVDFLRSVSGDNIDKASAALNTGYENAFNYQISKGFFYGPVVEPVHDGAFLTENMYELLSSGKYHKVPIIIGMNAEESLGLLGGDLSPLFTTYDEKSEILVPFDLHIEDESLKQDLGNQIKEFFVGSNGFESDIAAGIRYHSVHDFDKAQIKQAHLMSNHSTVYFYELIYSGLMGNNVNYKLEGTGNVTHAEELNYIFSRWYSNEIPDNTDLSYFPESDRIVHEYLMSIWTNFAKYLNPTPDNHEVSASTKWEPVDPNDFTYLEIGAELKLKKGFPKSESYNFWDKLYDNYAVPPLDTF